MPPSRSPRRAPSPSAEVPSKRPRFDPTSLGLPEEFILTDYTRLKGCSCKLPQAKLLRLLDDVSCGGDGAGVDCSIIPIQHRSECGEPLSLISTTDFFFPSVDDPFLQGQIGAANVLSDLYSMGVSECDTVLMLLATSTDMDEVEREATTREMMRGFAERVRRAGAEVTGGQTVMNPWPLIGGVAMRVAAESEMVRPVGRMRSGDVLVLTKPLGNQIAVNVFQWLQRPSPLYDTCLRGKLSEEAIVELYQAATAAMARLNREAARLMREHKAHGATDVTGFGILGHARNFGQAQDVGASNTRHLCLVLTRLPMYATAVRASRLMKDKYRLFDGFSAETSGGLLIALPNMETAERFVAELEVADGAPAWIVGHVAETEGDDYARLEEGYEIVEV